MTGQRFLVLHPGFWNHGPGPDFRGAVLQFAGQAPVTGDVEIDLDSSGWRSHQHDINPNFNRVILHVVWNPGPSILRDTCCLRSFLDSPWEVLAPWLGSGAARHFPEALTGQCCVPLCNLSDAELGGLLHEAARARLKAKAAHLASRARQAGWEQALWEGLFHGLGYKHNVWPMQRLGELRSRLGAGVEAGCADAWLARLLGVAGLLPRDLGGKSAPRNQYVRSLWDRWWRDRDDLSELTLPDMLWNWQGLRPANHPQRRLALAAQWLAAGEIPARIERWGLEAAGDRNLLESLRETLEVVVPDFWQWHWTTNSAALKRPQPLLGAPRLIDLAVNTIIPWLWSRAMEGRNESLCLELERRFFALPASENNALLRLGRSRLLADRPRRGLRGAAVQQGLLHIMKDFCAHSNAICADCEFPDLVRRWRE